jgi:hypothetical protein
MSSSVSASSASKSATKGRKASATAAPVAAAAPIAATKAVVEAPAKAVAAPVAAAAPAIAATTESTTAATTSTDVNVVSEYNSLVEQLNTLRSSLSSVFSIAKKLEKQIPRELKKASKGRRRKAAVTEGGEEKPKKPTVFTQPTQISDALCSFLGVAAGTLLSRSEVTARVCRYAKENKLMAKQVINADDKLRSLLSLNKEDELKILNLQRYLKPHYIKPAATA